MLQFAWPGASCSTARALPTRTGTAGPGHELAEVTQLEALPFVGETRPSRATMMVAVLACRSWASPDRLLQRVRNGIAHDESRPLGVLAACVGFTNGR